MKAFLPASSLSFLRLLLTFIVVFVNQFIAVAQTDVFTPAAVNENLLQTLAAKYEKLYKQELETLPSKNKKDYEEVYKLRWDNVKEKFDNKEFYTSATAQTYLDALVAEIVKANPMLQNKAFNCYFSRSGIPNASYLGEGIIILNMGLFERLDNESQAAFVIGHEIAHFYLQHSENSIRNYVTALNSTEVQKELRKIKSTEYHKREQLEKLVKGFTFDTRKHSRDHESQADSMAIELIKTTKFDIAEALTTLELLDNIDKDSLNTGAIVEQMFNAKDYPFQKRWLTKEEGLLGGHAKIDEDETLDDSLKTHPACKERIKILAPLVSRYKNTGAVKNVVDKPKFIELKNTSKYETIEYSYASDNYTKSLYYTLRLLQSSPNDPYLLSQVGRILNGCYTAQKAHTLGKVIDLPAPYFPPHYNLLLQFVQNLNREDFASLSYHFLKQYHPKLDYYTPFKNEYNTSIQIAQQ